MRLETWLDLKKTDRAEFAAKIGVSPASVTRIIAGTQNIPLSVQDAILRVTDGAVTPIDLHAAYAEAQQKAAAA